MTQRCCTMTQRCGAWILATYYTPCVRPSSDRNTHWPDCLEHPQTGLFGTPTDQIVWNIHKPYCLEHPQTGLFGTPTYRTVWNIRYVGVSDSPEHPQTVLFVTPTDRTVWNTHRPDCLEHPVCECSRQSGTPTDRTVWNTHRPDCFRSTLNYATAATEDAGSRMVWRHALSSVTSSLSGTTPTSPATVRNFSFQPKAWRTFAT